MKRPRQHDPDPGAQPPRDERGFCRCSQPSRVGNACSWCGGALSPEYIQRTMPKASTYGVGGDYVRDYSTPTNTIPAGKTIFQLTRFRLWVDKFVAKFGERTDFVLTFANTEEEARARVEWGEQGLSVKRVEVITV